MLGNSSDTPNPIDRFTSAAGSYLGRGRGEDDEPFVGELIIEPAVDGAGALLHFEARGDQPRPIHEDHMLIGKTRAGELYLWGLDSSSERIRKHELREVDDSSGPAQYRFGIGRPDNHSVVREEITFGFAGERVSLEYAFAEPGETLETSFAIDLVPEPQFSLSERSETTDLTYREFTSRPSEDTLAALEAIFEQVFDDERPADFDDDELWEDHRDVHLGVARADERLVGFKLGYQRRPDQFYSWLGAVLPAFRRRGIATELLTRQHAWADAHDYTSIRTKTTNQWRRMLILNLEHGFDVVGTEHDRHGELKIVLEKELA